MGTVWDSLRIERQFGLRMFETIQDTDVVWDIDDVRNSSEQRDSLGWQTVWNILGHGDHLEHKDNLAKVGSFEQFKTERQFGGGNRFGTV